MKKEIKKALKASVAILLTLMLTMSFMVGVMAEEATAADSAATAENEANQADGNASSNEGYTETNKGEVETDKAETETGEAETETGEVETGENTDTGWSDINRPESSTTLKTYGLSISGEGGYDAEYALTVMLITEKSMSSFDIEIAMPHFVNINSVEAGAGIEETDENIFMSDINGNTVTAAYVSDMEYMYEIEILTILFSVNRGNISGYPEVRLAEFSNMAPEIFSANFDIGEISVGTIQGGDNPSQYQMGDVNKDGTIDLADLMKVQRSLVYSYEYLDSEARQLADINHDGYVNILDCQYIKMYLVRKLDTLEGIYSGTSETTYCKINVYMGAADTATGANKWYIAESFEVRFGSTLYDALAEYGYNFNMVYSSPSLDEAFTSDMIVTSNMDVYLLENSYTQTSYLKLIAIEYGTFREINLDEVSETDIQVYATAKQWATENSDGGYYQFRGVFEDAECTTNISTDRTLSNGESMIVYVLMTPITYAGTFSIYYEIADEAGNVTQTAVGEVIMNDGSATVTYTDGSSKNGTYTYDGSTVSICFEDRSTLLLRYQNKSFSVMGEFNTDGYTPEEGMDFTPYAGTYALDDGNDVMTVELFDDGIFSAEVEGLKVYGSYRYELVSEGSANIYLDMFGDVEQFIFENGNLTFTENNSNDEAVAPDIDAGSNTDTTARVTVYGEDTNGDGEYDDYYILTADKEKNYIRDRLIDNDNDGIYDYMVSDDGTMMTPIVIK